MIRKCHNHKLQTNPWQRKNEPHYNHETTGRQTKQSNDTSLPDQDDCKTRMDIKQRTTAHTPTTGVTINNKSIAIEPTPQQPKNTGGERGLNASYWHQIFAPDSAAVEAQ